MHGSISFHCRWSLWFPPPTAGLLTLKSTLAAKVGSCCWQIATLGHSKCWLTLVSHRYSETYDSGGAYFFPKGEGMAGLIVCLFFCVVACGMISFEWCEYCQSIEDIKLNATRIIYVNYLHMVLGLKTHLPFLLLYRLRGKSLRMKKLLTAHLKVCILPPLYTHLAILSFFLVTSVSSCVSCRSNSRTGQTSNSPCRPL